MRLEDINKIQTEYPGSGMHNTSYGKNPNTHTEQRF